MNWTSVFSRFIFKSTLMPNLLTFILIHRCCYWRLKCHQQPIYYNPPAFFFQPKFLKTLRQQQKRNLLAFSNSYSEFDLCFSSVQTDVCCYFLINLLYNSDVGVLSVPMSFKDFTAADLWTKTNAFLSHVRAQHTHTHACRRTYTLNCWS